MADHEPEDYKIGDSQFMDLKIDLSLKPLIPRVETEYWVDLAIKDIKNKITQNNLSEVRVLDIFTGSGCVGLAVAKEVPEAIVTLTDVEPKFIDQAKFNAKLNWLDEDRLKFIVSDIFTNIPPDQKFDFILANPPYIPEGRKGELDKSVIDYEPHGALFSGVDGLDLIRTFLKIAKDYLNKNGQIWLEFDSGQKETLEVILQSGRSQTSTTFGSWVFYKDQYDCWRYVVITF